ncbi:10719_t:CDS:2, partial [Racocetra fulgida]
MAWVSHNQICLGLANEYSLININTGAITGLLMPSGNAGATQFYNMVGMGAIGAIGAIGAKVSKPLMIKLPNRILLAKDNISVFVDPDSNATRNAEIDWSGAPEEIDHPFTACTHFLVIKGYSYPYLIAVFPKHVEVRNVETLALVQTVELPQPKFINQGKYLYIANYTSVWRFIPLNFEKQIDQLIDQHQYEEAITKLRQIRTLLARNLFQHQKFDEAITIFQELETEPAEVIALYPPSISGTLHSDALHQQNLEKSETNHENGLTAVSSDQNEKISESEELVNGQKQKIFLGDISSGSSNVNGNYNHNLEIAEL